MKFKRSFFVIFVHTRRCGDNCITDAFDTLVVQHWCCALKLSLIGAEFATPLSTRVELFFLLGVSLASRLADKEVHIEDGAEVEETKHPEHSVRLEYAIHERVRDQVEDEDGREEDSQ